jgi:hypothetical protein
MAAWFMQAGKAAKGLAVPPADRARGEAKKQHSMRAPTRTCGHALFRGPVITNPRTIIGRRA